MHQFLDFIGYDLARLEKFKNVQHHCFFLNNANLGAQIVFFRQGIYTRFSLVFWPLCKLFG